jgi:hypothetical protein
MTSFSPVGPFTLKMWQIFLFGTGARPSTKKHLNATTMTTLAAMQPARRILLLDVTKVTNLRPAADVDVAEVPHHSRRGNNPNAKAMLHPTTVKGAIRVLLLTMARSMREEPLANLAPPAAEPHHAQHRDHRRHAKL